MIGPIEMGCPEDCRYRSMNLETKRLEYCEFNFKTPCKYFSEGIKRLIK